MKATVENLGPTKVKLEVEVPFEELKPSLDDAYKKLGRQVRVQGFRPGKVPPRILDQRVGRAAVLEEALQDAIPRFYSAAVEEQKLAVVSRPDVDVTAFGDGEPLVFSATVDIRPDVELPAYDGLPVTVDAVEVADEEIDKHLGSLQDRFAVLQSVERAVEQGDYVLLDLSATSDGEPVAGADATGLSYEVGTNGLIEGLDEAVLGASAGETRTFDAEIHFGEYAGRTATFSATVTAVKVKDVPALDDEFARTASEFDTIEELRGDTRERLAKVKRLEQGVQARDRVLEVLLARADVPLPESMVETEAEYRAQRLREQVQQAGMTFEQFLEANGQSEEEVDAEIRTGASEAVKAQLLLDAIGTKEELGVSETELTDQVVRRAQRAGMNPDELAQRLVQNNQLGALFGEIIRGKALALVLEQAVVTDTAGNAVDLSSLRDDGPIGDQPAAEQAEDEAETAEVAPAP